MTAPTDDPAARRLAVDDATGRHRDHDARHAHDWQFFVDPDFDEDRTVRSLRVLQRVRQLALVWLGHLFGFDAILAPGTILGPGHTLGLEVFAEGVETAEPRKFFALHGCRAFQGYLVERPVTAEQF